MDRGSRGDLIARLRRLQQARMRMQENPPDLDESVGRERRRNPVSCDEGEIPVRRRAYKRRDGTRVRATEYCAPDRGKPGRGKKLFTIKRRGDLGGPGYLDKKDKERQKLLDKSVKKYGYRSTLGKIHALEILGKNTYTKKQLQKLKKDRTYLRKKYGGPGSFGPRKNPEVAVYDEPSDDALVQRILSMFDR